jgi:hypothetical protein
MKFHFLSANMPNVCLLEETQAASFQQPCSGHHLLNDYTANSHNS